MIQHPKDRYRLIDHAALLRLLAVDSSEMLATTRLGWISSELKKKFDYNKDKLVRPLTPKAERRVAIVLSQNRKVAFHPQNKNYLT